MKKTIIALMALASYAGATSITLDASYYKSQIEGGAACYVYVWDDSQTSGAINDGKKWDYLAGTGDKTLNNNSANWTPGVKNTAFIGYTFAMKDGKQVMSSTSTAITVTDVFSNGTWIQPHSLYLGSNVTVSFTSAGVFGQNTTRYYNFGDFSGSSVISLSQLHVQRGATINFSGDVVMTDDTFSYTMLTSTSLMQMNGTWNAAGVTVVDKMGERLVYTTDADKIGTAGYYWVETKLDSVTGVSSVMLKAKSVPEPTTATLSLLALCGLAARRRRK